MITIKEIASLAGVSRGTVDRVVNKRGSVSHTVEQRIRDIIRQHGFRPNRIARALVKKQKVQTIGMISASTENVFFRDVVEGMRRAHAEVKDYGIALAYREVAKFSVDDQLGRIDELLKTPVDALAINPINDNAIREKLREVAASGIPVITFNSDIEGVNRLAYIGCDYKKTGRIAAGLIALATNAAATVAIVTGSMKSLGHALRIEGFREELARCPGIRAAEVIEMFDDDITSYAAVRKLLERDETIDAFFFSAGGKEGGIRAILEAGREPAPKIVTVDLDAFTAECLREGTVSATVCQQPFVQGYEPIRQLADFLMQGEAPARQIQYTQAEIILRQSL
jgi:LacI family transcriptional regulator